MITALPAVARPTAARPAGAAVAPPAASTQPRPVVPSIGAHQVEARRMAENLARCVVEILAGSRQLDQIARWLSTEVHAHLLKRVVLSQRARHVRAEAPARPAIALGRTVLSEPSPGVVEAVVIVHGRARSRAVAIRLERQGARWRASAITVL